ncbi:LuxR C-terminal-related transcriptional regulator [Streptomyces sp. H10-C2]|uniref:ATP-binding protein n=1 Tax=unclassified Streptomyces TaxID=2593676 RepID=UPI0024B9A5EF|nr:MULTISPECIES: LuxR family transcriptional regulator [unclassified Streptomyces]MDJ0342591.1 LuxR C-terminal-related transcriptional regulator [Streptomyces sp. PH10-H1]MDJ0368555.1 LuxR C-terminal-related transcriptional regulator [Streptomyces sp. H10-C2]
MASELLERSSLLADLDRGLAETGSGGRIALVSGEAGIGKSALVRRFIQQHDGDTRVLVGLCDPLLTPRTLGPLYDIAAQTGGALAGQMAAEAGREVIFSALLDELAHCRRPQVVVVEDVHWADEATLDLLVFLGRRLERLPALLVVSYRDDELDLDHPLRTVLGDLPPERTRHLRPAPLSEAAVAELARRAGRQSAGLHATTGGNPLLVTEVLAANEPGVPRAVSALTLARFAALDPAAQEAVRFVAVIPTRAELWLLQEALHADSGVVEECVTAGLLVLADETIGFRHELNRRALEESLSTLRRRELNQQALTVLSAADRGTDIARLAHHAREAGDTPAVLRYAPAAAAKAEALGAHREAVGHYRAALRHADRLSPPKRAGLLEGYSYNGYLIGIIDEALAARQAALEIWESANQREKAGENLRWLSRLHWWAGQRNEAEAAAARAITTLELGEPGRQLAMAYSNQSQLDMLADRTAAAIGWGSRALVLARRIGDRETLAHALTNIGSARLHDGDPAGRAELTEAIDVAIDEKLPDHAARALVNLAFTSVENHDYPRAAHYVERALEFALTHDLNAYAQYLTGTRAWTRLDLGDWAGAESDARQALKEREQPGTSVVPALCTLGRLQARRGDPRASLTLDEAARRAFDSGELQRIGPVAAARAEHAWLRGDRENTAAEAIRGFELAVERRHRWFAGELAWWLRRAGQRPRVPEWVAEPYRFLLSGDWRRAADAWEALGHPYDQADALSCGDEDAALRALALFDGLGAAAAAQQVRRMLRSRGRLRVPRGPRPATVGNPAHLTARQLQILHLLAAGKRNAEIAARLSLSVRTVDHHVAAVLSKLGVGSRDQAAPAARLLGIVLPQDRQPDDPD